jgi:2,3-bisphosphoglycerate-independent phosphoglycerate mutase
LKSLVVLGCGIAGECLPDFEGRTPVEAADTSSLDKLTACGESGGWETIRPGGWPGPEATLSEFFGINETLPRGPLEAVGAGVDLGEGEIAFRANFVCLRPGTTSVLMFDAAGCGISDEEGASITAHLNGNILCDSDEVIRLISLGGYRALLTYQKRGFKAADQAIAAFSPPHEIMGQPIGGHLPTLNEARRFVHIVNDSQMILAGHPGLKKKQETAMFAANSLWLWGGGVLPRIAPIFRLLGGRNAVMVSNCRAALGMGQLGGAQVGQPSETGAAGRAEMVKAAREALRENDFVMLCVDDPAEALLASNFEGLTASIEAIDKEIIGPLIEDPGAGEPCRILALSDRVGSLGPSPWAMAEWRAGALHPPAPPGGLTGLWRNLTRGRLTAAPSPRTDVFSEKLCENWPPLSGKALRMRLLAK